MENTQLEGNLRLLLISQIGKVRRQTIIEDNITQCLEKVLHQPLVNIKETKKQ